MLGFVEAAAVPTSDSETNVNNVNGIEARQTYENILQIPSTSSISSDRAKTPVVPKRVRTKRKCPFDELAFFSAATNGHLDTLQRMNIDAMNVNRTDAFGWTALMMAACAGHLECVTILVHAGARRDYTDKHGHTAISLAEKEKQTDVAEYLHALNRLEEDVICLSSDDDCESTRSDANSVHTIHCALCELEFKEKEEVLHKTSTLHRFNDRTNQKTIRGFAIPESNVGYQMMLKQGWSGEHGLGCKKHGTLYPVKTVLRKPRSGLGVKQPAPAKVTHFHANDRTAVRAAKPPRPICAVKTKRQIRHEKERSQRRDRYLRRLLS